MFDAKQELDEKEDAGGKGFNAGWRQWVSISSTSLAHLSPFIHAGFHFVINGQDMSHQTNAHMSFPGSGSFSFSYFLLLLVNLHTLTKMLATDSKIQTPSGPAPSPAPSRPQHVLNPNLLNPNCKPVQPTPPWFTHRAILQPYNHSVYGANLGLFSRVLEANVATLNVSERGGSPVQPIHYMISQWGPAQGGWDTQCDPKHQGLCHIPLSDLVMPRSCLVHFSNCGQNLCLIWHWFR